MAERPILFSAPMVRALLAGTKTQTRRVLKPQPGDDGKFADLKSCYRAHRIMRGDRLWVRETWAVGSIYDGMPPRDINPGGKPGWCGIRYAATDERFGIKDRVSIHMPRWASRLTLTVTDVRVQRLQDISEEDAIAEGATHRLACSGFMGRNIGWSMDWSVVGQPSRFARNGGTLAERDVSLGSAVSAFAGFINGLHDPKWNHNGDGIFGANPWVAAYTFTVARRNIDASSQGGQPDV